MIGRLWRSQCFAPPTDNRPMRYFLLAATLCGTPIFNACSPTFNWRDAGFEQGPLVALFPCKPDQGARVVSLGSKDVTMTMLGCDAGGATFTLAYADTKDAAMTGAVLDQWKKATLGNMRAQTASERPFLIKGASMLPQSVQVEARGSRGDGRAVATHVVWFAAGSLVFQAAVYAETVSPVVAETYFAGLRLQ